MIIKLLKPWGASVIGDKLDNVSKPIADILIKRGIGAIYKPRKKKAKKCSNTK